MTTLSTTQVTNVTAMAGVIVMVLQLFKVEVAQDEVVSVIGAALTIISIITNFVNRYQKGDVSLAGVKKY